MILPRQARDKHRESTQRKMPFFAPDSFAFSSRYSMRSSAFTNCEKQIALADGSRWRISHTASSSACHKENERARDIRRSVSSLSFFFCRFVCLEILVLYYYVSWQILNLNHRLFSYLKSKRRVFLLAPRPSSNWSLGAPAPHLQENVSVLGAFPMLVPSLSW